MKKFAALMAIVVAVMFSASLVIGAQAPAGKVIIKEIQKSKPEVTFDHKGHAKRIGLCQTCHHMPDSEKCSDCHEVKSTGAAPSFSEAMHIRCRGCHKKMTNEGLSGSCSECHPNVRSGK